MGALIFLVGCDTKGFMDPSEMGRYKHDPLLMPIVSQVDPAIEEGDTQWSQAAEPTADDLKPVTGDYRISPNDLLSITLSDINGPNTETVKQSRVTQTGNISLPYIDQPVHAAGSTEIQLEQSIVEAYRTANLIQHAQVSVTVIEARGRAYNILGAVQQPGEFAIVESEFRLLNALVVARNVSTPFVEYIYVVRRLGEEPAATQPAITAPTNTNPASAPSTGPSSEELAPKTEANSPVDVQAANTTRDDRGAHLTASAPPQASEPAGTVNHSEKVVLAAQAIPGSFDGFRDPGPYQNVRVIRIPYEALKRGELQYNISIHPHDVIYAAEPPTGFYYVGGHVQRPGAYQLAGQRVTVKDAIIAASMLDGIAIPQRTDIIRHIHPNSEVFVRVDLEKIFSGQQPDIYIKPDDKIMVGTNAVAPFLAAIRGGFRITYGFGFLYDRNYAYPTTVGAGIP